MIVDKRQIEHHKAEGRPAPSAKLQKARGDRPFAVY